MGERSSMNHAVAATTRVPGRERKGGLPALVGG